MNNHTALSPADALTLNDTAKEGLQDRSAEIATHLASARAIADLIETVCGSHTDGSENKLDLLERRTLSSAAYAMRQHIERVKQLQFNQDKWLRTQGKLP